MAFISHSGSRLPPRAGGELTRPHSLPVTHGPVGGPKNHRGCLLGQSEQTDTCAVPPVGGRSFCVLLEPGRSAVGQGHTG